MREYEHRIRAAAAASNANATIEGRYIQVLSVVPQ